MSLALYSPRTLNNFNQSLSMLEVHSSIIHPTPGDKDILPPLLHCNQCLHISYIIHLLKLSTSPGSFDLRCLTKENICFHPTQYVLNKISSPPVVRNNQQLSPLKFISFRLRLSIYYITSTAVRETFTLSAIYIVQNTQPNGESPSVTGLP